jgi:hypothetical protein
VNDLTPPVYAPDYKEAANKNWHGIARHFSPVDPSPGLATRNGFGQQEGTLARGSLNQCQHILGFMQQAAFKVAESVYSEDHLPRLEVLEATLRHSRGLGSRTRGGTHGRAEPIKDMLPV